MTTPSGVRLFCPVLAVMAQKRPVRWVRHAAGLGVVAIVAAGCSSAEVATTTTTAVGSTITTTAVGSTTTTTGVGSTTIPDTNSLADGSGCTPGTTDGLPDGAWFGYIEDPATDGVDFDLACWFTGTAAAQAAEEDGEESPPPNDFYVRNVNSTVRTLAVAADASVTWLPNPGDPGTEETVAFLGWLDERTDRTFQPGVWLTIEKGAIVDIREQYTP